MTVTGSNGEAGDSCGEGLDPEAIDPVIPADLHPAIEVARRQWRDMYVGMELDGSADVIVLALDKAGLLCTGRRHGNRKPCEVSAGDAGSGGGGGSGSVATRTVDGRNGPRSGEAGEDRSSMARKVTIEDLRALVAFARVWQVPSEVPQVLIEACTTAFHGHIHDVPTALLRELVADEPDAWTVVEYPDFATGAYVSARRSGHPPLGLTLYSVHEPVAKNDGIEPAP